MSDLNSEIDFDDLSRTVSHALRHQPQLYNLQLDETGAVEVSELVQSLKESRPEWNGLTVDLLVQILSQSSKRRHCVSAGRIRALYGHSFEQRIKITPEIPPSVLFHGTKGSHLSRILELGILPMSRQFVHLCSDLASALSVARRRHSKPIVIRVDSAEAHINGVKFYFGSETIWLSDAVPSRFIRFDE